MTVYRVLEKAMIVVRGADVNDILTHLLYCAANASLNDFANEVFREPGVHTIRLSLEITSLYLPGVRFIGRILSQY